MFSSNTTQVSSDAAYIEDVFSTWLYTGNGSTQTINNGIDLAGKGGLVWLKSRTQAESNQLYDTVRGAGFQLRSNTTGAQFFSGGSTGNLDQFTSSGFTLGSDSNTNASGQNYASWTFRKQPKFFDVVTYTGNGGTLSVNHALASKPGCIIIKRTDSTGDWLVCARKSDGNIFAMYLNQTAGQFYDGTEGSLWTPTTVSINWINSNVASGYNNSGAQYVMYLFAHNAGGFGATGADNVISCGSFTTDADGFATVNLGYEPQWVLMKRTDSTGSWTIFDNMRGWSSSQAQLFPNNSNAEGVGGPLEILQATGFATKAFSFASNATNIYIAIRRGPMRTPTSGASVFNSVVYTGTNVDNRLVDTTIAPDMVWVRQRNDPVLLGMVVGDRLRAQPYLLTASTAAEVNDADAFDAQLVDAVEYGNAFSAMNGFWCGNDATAKLNANTSPNNHVAEAFRRAPGFFDVVCYTGNGTPGRTVSHNLGVVPELMIVKRRDAAAQWPAYAAPLGATNFVSLNLTNASAANSQIWNDTAPTASVFTVGSNMVVNSGAPGTYVAYLFASCPGVSKVGSFTGTGSTQVINCGFAAGARFVLIKRTDSTGDWYVWDSARGIVAGNDPYLLLNSTAAEVTNTDWVNTAASGFELSNAGGNLVNINGGSYIFLAIA